MQAIYVPADDLTDPAPATSFAHLDATTVLSRSIAEKGFIRQSIPSTQHRACSRHMVVGEEHYNVARRCSRSCSATRSSKILSPFLAWTSCPKKTSLRLARARKIQRYLSQPFHVAEVFTGAPGVFVELADTIRGFKGLCEGKYDYLPEAAFYMVGTIEQAVEKGKRLAAEAA